MSTKTILIGTMKINPDNMHLLGDYSALTRELMAKHGGKIISVYKVSETVLGDGELSSVGIFEFPDAESIKNFLNSKEYIDQIPTRDKCLSEMNYFISTVG